MDKKKANNIDIDLVKPKKPPPKDVEFKTLEGYSTK